MKLILIRHGQTSFNAKKRYVGHTDCPLNKEGVRQAGKTARHLKSQRFHKIYSSDLRRARDFARIIFKDTPVSQTKQLREINFGSFEGLTHTQITTKHPVFYASWLKKPQAVKFPKGESLSDLKKRVEKCIKHIYTKNKGKAIAVISHAGPIKVILKNALRTKDFWQIDISNASLSIIEYKNNAKLVTLINDTSFL